MKTCSETAEFFSICFAPLLRMEENLGLDLYLSYTHVRTHVRYYYQSLDVASQHKYIILIALVVAGILSLL